MNRLPLLLLFTLPILAVAPGCFGSKKPKPNPNIAAETEESFRQRWVARRIAELQAGPDAPDGRSPLRADNAGAGSSPSFDRRYAGVAHRVGAWAGRSVPSVRAISTIRRVAATASSPVQIVTPLAGSWLASACTIAPVSATIGTPAARAHRAGNGEIGPGRARKRPPRPARRAP